MKKQSIQTIIIGGGMSGLACARKLHSAKKEFILITKELGGRMKASQSFVANYGAAYITEDYHHVIPLVRKGEPMRIRDFYFYTGKGFTNIFSFQNLRFIYKGLKLVFFSWRIRRHILLYRKKAEHKSLQECFQEDPFLMKYWLMPAREFIQKHHLEDINHFVVDPVTSATAFVHYKEVNTVYYLAMVFPLFLKTWIVDFSQTIEKLTAGYEKSIKLGKVKKVKKRKDGKYDVSSSAGDYIATNVVFAAPQKQLKKVYHLPSMNIQKDTYVFNVQGARKQLFANKKAIVFQDQHYDIHMIWRQRDGTDIIYTQHKSPYLGRYYQSHKVLKRVHWQPAMIIPTCCIIDQVIDNNLYIASDFNVSGLEDSYLSGVYAANQIIKNKKKSAVFQVGKYVSSQRVRKEQKIKKGHKSSVIDPICKMIVTPEQRYSLSVKGKEVYFCGKSCLIQYKNTRQ